MACTVSGYVFDDSERTSTRASTDSGIAGCSIVLFNATTSKAQETTTDSSGYYTFDVSDAGSYTLYEPIISNTSTPPTTFTQPTNYNQVKLGNNISIYPQVYIGDNVKIGENVTLYPGVKIYHDCIIGDNCIIQAGAVIGSDGFGFAPTNSGYQKIAQIGNVILENNVEIGANTTIDRATMGSTIIREGVKLDNLIQVAHNVEIGKNTVMAAQVGIAGSSKVGENCMFGGQVGVAGHISVGDNVIIGAQSGVPNSVDSNQRVLGYPAVNARDFAKQSVMIKKLPDLNSTIKELRKEIELLKEKMK